MPFSRQSGGAGRWRPVPLPAGQWRYVVSARCSPLGGRRPSRPANGPAAAEPAASRAWACPLRRSVKRLTKLCCSRTGVALPGRPAGRGRRRARRSGKPRPGGMRWPVDGRGHRGNRAQAYVVASGPARLSGKPRPRGVTRGCRCRYPCHCGDGPPRRAGRGRPASSRTNPVPGSARYSSTAGCRLCRDCRRCRTPPSGAAR